MDPDIIIGEAVAIVICLLLSAFFSGSETALTSLSPSKANQLIDDGKPWLRLWLEHPIEVLTTILIGNNIVNVASSALATDLAARLLAGSAGENWAIPAAVGVMTFLLLTFGEITPKTISKRFPMKISSIAIRILKPLYYICIPATKIFVKVTQLVMRLFGGDPDKPSPFVTFEEIEYLIELGAREGQFEDGKEKLLMAAVDFPDTIVREIMIPRTDMTSLSRESTMEEVLEELVKCGHSRLPVFGESLDDICGVFYAKDLIQIVADKKSESFSLEKQIRPPYFIPETKKIEDLLTSFRDDRIHMAIVVDEFGGTAGLITLEDIIEEVFGEIQDEHDNEEAQLSEINGVVIADARTDIEDLEEFFETDFPEAADYETLAGFLLSEAGEIPAINDEIFWKQFKFKIIDADEKQIIQVEIEKGLTPEESEALEELSEAAED